MLYIKDILYQIFYIDELKTSLIILIIICYQFSNFLKKVKKIPLKRFQQKESYFFEAIQSDTDFDIMKV